MRSAGGGIKFFAVLLIFASLPACGGGGAGVAADDHRPRVAWRGVSVAVPDGWTVLQASAVEKPCDFPPPRTAVVGDYKFAESETVIDCSGEPNQGAPSIQLNTNEVGKLEGLPWVKVGALYAQIRDDKSFSNSEFVAFEGGTVGLLLVGDLGGDRQTILDSVRRAG